MNKRELWSAQPEIVAEALRIKQCVAVKCSCVSKDKPNPKAFCDEFYKIYNKLAQAIEDQYVKDEETLT